MKVEVQCVWHWLIAAAMVVSLSSTWLPAEAATDPGDLIVLNKLRQEWGGATTSLWGSTADPCGGASQTGWDGVVCNATTNRVTSLYLISKQLVGSITADIGALSALEKLDLSFNPGLTGPLPTELGNLTLLTSLSLQACNFSGSIPVSLGNLTNLTYLALNNNNFTGSIPPSLGALANLKWFDVAYNSLSGHLPVSTTNQDRIGLDTLPVIEHYHLSNNSFSGSIPPELGGAKHCLHMLLEFNAFTGPIPETFGNLSNLQILSLHYNQLTGTIPATLNNIVQVGNASTGLHQLRVNNNQLTGTIPTLSVLNQLEFVDFSGNFFDAQPYPVWLNLSSSSLLTIIFENSNLTGPLPPDVLSYPSLQSLLLEGNALNGSLTIPSNLGSGLQVVSLQNNSITGLVPLTNNISALEIELQGNPFCTNTGIVTPNPRLCNGTTPTSTQWTSPLQNSCGPTDSCGQNAGLMMNPQTCTCLAPLVIVLEIRSPPFSDIDNTALWDNLKTQTLKFFNNKSLSTITLDPNQIFVRNASFSDARRVLVEMDFFPLTGYSLDWSTQDAIQRSFTLQQMQYDKTFKPWKVSSILPPLPVQVLAGKHGIQIGTIIGISVGAGVLLILVGMLGFLAFMQKRRADKAVQSRPFASWGGGGVDNSEAPKLKGARWFSFDEIRKITNNFSADNEIGVGGYGKVYKGIVPGTGEQVAVKRAQEGSMQGAQEFKNEIELLSRVHHRNLVGLVGFCYEQGEQMLVYEFMPNGTLTDWLRGTRSNAPLDWKRRVCIALGSARGLAYLHDNANPSIIHRDVKSCNILLDEKLVAKVADFGLSSLAPDSGDKLNTQVKGTMGYLDPEYYMTGLLSSKSDVYSFGVVLLELLTGRPPLHRDFYVVRDVKSTFKKAGMDGVWEMLDPVLVGTPVQELERFLMLALACVEDTGAERPSMSVVEKQLESLVEPESLALVGDELTRSSKKLQPQQQTQFVSGDHETVHSSTSHDSSPFTYSGAFAPSPVRPK